MCMHRMTAESTGQQHTAGMLHVILLIEREILRSNRLSHETTNVKLYLSCQLLAQQVGSIIVLTYNFKHDSLVFKLESCRYHTYNLHNPAEYILY